MRKIVLLFVLLFGLLDSNAQGVDSMGVSYEHPFKQGDAVWGNFKSASERIKALQIPDELLPRIPTDHLLRLCLDFPYLMDMFAFNSLEEGFKALVSEFNGFKELQKRADMAVALLNEYEGVPRNIYKVKFASDKELGDFSFRYFVLTYMLAKAVKAPGLSESQEGKIVKAITMNKDMIADNPDIFGKLSLMAADNLEDSFTPSNSLLSSSLVEGQIVQMFGRDYIVTKRHTPRNGYVWAELLNDDDFTDAEKNALMNHVIYNYGGSVVSEATLSYNCHSYAWHMSEGHLDDQVWIGYEETGPDEYWNDGSYIEVPESLATKVRYTNDHSAIRVSSSLYHSKWGSWPLVAHAPYNVPSKYGVPYKYYKRTPPITGPSIVCTEATYLIDGLPSSYTVTWAFKENSSLNSLIHQNTPSANQCTIIPGDTGFDKTLVATIWKNNTALCTVEKGIMTPCPLNGTIHQEGTYYHGMTYPSFTIEMDPLFIMNQACDVTLQSPKFKYMNFSTYTNPNTAVSLQRIDDETIKIRMGYQTTNVELRIYGTADGSCNDFELRTVAQRFPLVFGTPVHINMHGSRISLDLDQALLTTPDRSYGVGIAQQPYTFDIFEATTGRKVYSGQIGEEMDIDTTGWNTGVYIINVVVNGKTYSSKMTKE